MQEIDWDNYQPVEGHSHLYRDKSTGAIINMDFDRFDAIKKRKKLAEKRIKEQEQLSEKVNNLESDISDIKTLLTQLLEK